MSLPTRPRANVEGLLWADLTWVTKIRYVLTFVVWPVLFGLYVHLEWVPTFEAPLNTIAAWVALLAAFGLGYLVRPRRQAAR